jgi:hypothetical protein
MFSGIFLAAPSQKWFEVTPYKLRIRYLCTVPEMQKYSDVLRASLNNSFKDYWRLRINDTIIRADCKQIKLHWGWNKRESVLGGVWVTYLKINFGLRLGRAKWSSGRAKRNYKISARSYLYQVEHRD